jgi:hypothetical protein
MAMLKTENTTGQGFNDEIFKSDLDPGPYSLLGTLGATQ